jgi:oxygenase
MTARQRAARQRDSDVIVVGAGPVGLMLAGELRLAGADVLVLERLAEPHGESRASQLNARTMEIFDQRGILAVIGQQGPGKPEREDRGHVGGLPLRMDDVDSEYAGNWKIPQYRTEAALQEWATGLGARLLRGHELAGLEVSDEQIEAVTSTTTGAIRFGARYLVGCDGEDSMVRWLHRFDFPGHDAGMELLRADVSGAGIPDRRFERLDRGLAIAATRGGVTRVMMHEYGRPAQTRTESPSFDEIVETWSRITGEDLTGADLIWSDAFGDTGRQASRYRKGRVLLAGDAAHAMMPVGGQALNIGLQDAVNLGWKLGAEVRGWAPPGLLDTYHDERHPVGERVLTSVEAQKMLLLGDHRADAIRQVFAEVLGLESARRHLASMLSGLDVRYPVDAGDHPLLGARIPGLSLRAGRGALVDGTGSAAIRDVASGWADRVDVVPAELAHSDPASKFDMALVRPDGHAVHVNGPDGELREALYRWFGTPSPDNGERKQQ